jgi:hypothetical protein
MTCDRAVPAHQGVGAQVIGEQCVDEFRTALGDEIRAVFPLQALHVGDVAQEH